MAESSLDLSVLAPESGATIALTGPSGVGKTTFAQVLSFAAGAPIHAEGARDWLLSRGVDAYWKMDGSLVVEMQEHLLSRFESSPSLIFDRCSIDMVVFLERAREYCDFEDFVRRARQAMERIDVIVYFPYRSELLGDDGVRRPDDLYQVRIGGQIADVIVEWGCESRTVVYHHHRSVLDNMARIAAAVA